VGMQSGQVYVFDFKQSLRCVCGQSSEGGHRYSLLLRMSALRRRMKAKP
jgi:hypothetical protein